MSPRQRKFLALMQASINQLAAEKVITPHTKAMALETLSYQQTKGEKGW